MPIALILALCTVSFVSSKGYRVTATLLAADLGAGPLVIGLLFALWGLFPFLLSVYAGRVADRFDNRKLMVYGLVGFTVSLALPSVFPSIPTLFVSSAVGGLTSMVFVVATQNLIGLLSNERTRTRNFSYYSLGESIAGVLGPVLVGVCIDAIRHPATFAVVAAVNGSCLVMLLAVQKRIPDAPRRGDPGAPRSARELLSLPALRNALIANGAVMAGLDLFQLYMPLYAHQLGFSATTIGVIVGAFGAAAIVTRLALPRLASRWGEHLILSTALAIAAAAFVSIPFTREAALLGAAAFALGLALGCGQPLSIILAFNAAPAGRSAEAIAMRLAVSYGAHVVIPPVFGAVGAAMGLAPIFWTCAAVLGGGSVVTRPKR